MTWFCSVVIIFSSILAHADGIETSDLSEPLKVESITTEPRELPDPIDQPPVLEYAKPPTPTAISTRTPANVNMQKYVDPEHGVVCYYLVPVLVPGVATSSAPAMSCVRLEQKTQAPAPRAPVPPPDAR